MPFASRICNLARAPPLGGCRPSLIRQDSGRRMGDTGRVRGERRPQAPAPREQHDRALPRRSERLADSSSLSPIVELRTHAREAASRDRIGRDAPGGDQAFRFSREKTSSVQSPSTYPFWKCSREWVRNMSDRSALPRGKRREGSVSPSHARGTAITQSWTSNLRVAHHRAGTGPRIGPVASPRRPELQPAIISACLTITCAWRTDAMSTSRPL
jgi:hypothetical protein